MACQERSLSHALSFLDDYENILLYTFIFFHPFIHLTGVCWVDDSWPEAILNIEVTTMNET